MDNFENFLTKAKLKHGEKYDYSLVEYVNKLTPIKIICPKHGMFEQMPKNHLRANCYFCGFENISTTKSKNGLSESELIKQFYNIHGDKYDYSNLEYKNMSSKIQVMCKHHNRYFYPRAYRHLEGSICKFCKNDNLGAMRKLDTKSFIEEATKKHKNLYSYKNTVYIDSKTQVIITCPIHNDYPQNPSDHLSGRGCSKCADEKHGIKSRLPIEELQKTIDIKFENKYILDKITYKGQIQAMKIYCNECQEWFIKSPRQLLTSQGHNDCSFNFCGYKRSDFINRCEQYNKDKGKLYLVKLVSNKETVYKIGITSKALDSRFIKIKKYYTIVKMLTYTSEGGKIYDMEKHYLKHMRKLKQKPLEDFQGWTECFENNIKLEEFFYSTIEIFNKDILLI